MFWSVVLGVMALTIFKQSLLNFNTFNHFKVDKCLQMTKTKHLRKVKQNWKRLFSAFFFVTFRKGIPLDKKRMRAHDITQIVQTRKSTDEHGFPYKKIAFDTSVTVFIACLKHTCLPTPTPASALWGHFI